MVFTPLHRELGLEPSDMSHELIRAAVAEGVREQDDLDWKQVVPVKEAHGEFAKDVAAMANSGGGLLVFGVGEAPDQTTAADSLTHVEKWGDGERRRLREVAYSAIRPPVHGLNFYELESSGVRTIVLDVPGSAEVPHLIWVKEKFSAPLRYGALTQYMGERQLETAYAQRRQARTDLRTRLEGAANNAVDPVMAPRQVWLSVTAAPTRPRPAHLPRLTSDEFTDIVTAGTVWNPFVVNGPSGLAVSPRPRYRRWVSISFRNDIADDLVEVHDDGTLVYAVALETVRDGDSGDLHPQRLQQAPAEAIWLLRKANAKLTPGSEYIVRVNLHADSWPVYFRSTSDSGSYVEDRDNRIVRFEPVEITVDPQASVEGLARTVWELVGDVVNQGGVKDPSDKFLDKSPEE